MVDYNLQVPGIAPAQSSQINPLQMLPMLQQQQLNNMLIQERARELQETNALRQYLRGPNVDLTTRQGMLGALSVAPKAGAPVITAAATATREARQGETSQAQTAQIMQQIQAGVLKMGTDQFNDLRERLAVVDVNDPKSYAEWHKLAASKLPGVTLPSPKDWAAAPPEARQTIQQRLMTTAEAIRKDIEEGRKPREQDIVDRGGTTFSRPKAVRPGEPVIETPVLRRQPNAAAPFVDNPAAGVPSFPVPANRMADINQRSALYGGLPAQIAPPAQAGPLTQEGLTSSNTFRQQLPAGKMANRVEPPLTIATAPTEIERAAAQAYGAKRGQQAAELQETERKTDVDLTRAVTELEAATKKGGLLDKSTGSLVGSLIDKAAGTIGVATPGAQAAAKLAPIADMALKMVPRFEGPQSDADRRSYEVASGQLADSTQPIETRRAAAQTVARLMRERAGQFETRKSPLADGERGPAPAGGAVTVPVPGGRVFTFPNQAAADRFRREAGL